MEQDLLKIINNYGVLSQLKYFQSEVFELNESIIKHEALGCEYQHIAEEISDVLVMLKQFQYYYEIEDEQIEEVMRYKINRQLKRIENKNNITQ